MLVKYALLWFPMLAIAIMNGILREFFIKKHVNDLAAHQLSTLTLIVLFAVYIWFVMARFPPGSADDAMLIGMLWLVLTLVFEFGFGRWRGNSWQTLLADYNLAKGRLWLLIPVWVALAPLLFYKLRN
jgi:hypothetical protein